MIHPNGDPEIHDFPEPVDREERLAKWRARQEAAIARMEYDKHNIEE